MSCLQAELVGGQRLLITQQTVQRVEMKQQNQMTTQAFQAGIALDRNKRRPE